ncbi:MAG TPA: 2-dehydropantoate 2-reductase [Candidatus Thermoplasmatota archaeon]|nr:2-dehydropantoate 2-reductase [Candidatus Thermoplasmatota archaeon]
MKIVVFGAGAIGSLLGALLSKAHDVTLIGRRDHVNAIRKQGLTITGNLSLNVRIDAQETATPGLLPDLVLLTVKAYDTVQAVGDLAPLMGPKTILLVAQNGLGNLEVAKQRYPNHRVVAASVTVGGAMDAPGRVSWNGPGELIVGALPADEATARLVVAAFAETGIAARAVADIRPALWRKALINAAINPLTALHRIENGPLLDDAALRKQLFAAGREAAAVMRAEGIPITDEESEALLETITKKTARNRSSMLQSVERGRPTEIDAITGKILQAARKHGIPCPVNDALFEGIKKIEATFARA